MLYRRSLNSFVFLTIYLWFLHNDISQAQQRPEPTNFHMEDKGPEVQVTANSRGVKINTKPAGLEVSANSAGKINGVVPKGATRRSEEIENDSEYQDGDGDDDDDENEEEEEENGQIRTSKNVRTSRGWPKFSALTAQSVRFPLDEYKNIGMNDRRTSGLALKGRAGFLNSVSNSYRARLNHYFTTVNHNIENHHAGPDIHDYMFWRHGDHHIHHHNGGGHHNGGNHHHHGHHHDAHHIHHTHEHHVHHHHHHNDDEDDGGYGGDNGYSYGDNHHRHHNRHHGEHEQRRNNDDRTVNELLHELLS